MRLCPYCNFLSRQNYLAHLSINSKNVKQQKSPAAESMQQGFKHSLYIGTHALWLPDAVGLVMEEACGVGIYLTIAESSFLQP
jgi:hypothetical protein